MSAVFEILPYPSGLPRNIEQCLNDYNIPLYLSHSVVEVKGKKRIESVIVEKVDENLKPIPGSEQEFPCDTLILSVGLIPENELSLAAGVTLDHRTGGAIVDESFQTQVPGIFAAGNVLHVHDLVDFVSLEAETLAEGVAEYLKKDGLAEARISISTDDKIGHIVPQKITGTKDVQMSLRVKRPQTACKLQILQDEHVIKEMRLPKAIPAEMIQLQIKAKNFVSKNDLEVKISDY